MTARTASAALLLAALLAAAPGPAGAAPLVSVPTAVADTGTLQVPDVPYLAQSEALCGGAASAMVLRYWGDRTIRAEDFRPLVSGEPAGIATDELVSKLRGLGWRARPLASGIGTLAEQLEAGRPVLALQRVGPDRYHYVVVLAVTADRVLYHDPAQGPYRVADREAWTADWAAADRWAAVVWPGKESVEASPDRPAPAGTAREEAGGDRPTGCSALVRRGVARARTGASRAGRAALRAAADLCPDRARPWVELAGLAFQEGEYGTARRLATRAAERSDAGEHAWRLLGSSRYLDGDPLGALRAWNRLDLPAVGHVRIEGLERTRHRVALRLLGLEPGTVLTPGRLAAARRRLGELPALRRARVDYRALEGDRVEVRVAARERRMPGTSPARLAALALRGLSERAVRVNVPSPTGGGGEVSAAWRWSAGRPRLGLSVAAPAPLGVGDRWEASARWERQTYATEAGAPDAGGGAGGDAVVETSRSGELSAAGWLSSSWRTVLSAGVDRATGGRTGAASYLGTALGAVWHPPGAGWAGRLRLRSGLPLGSGGSAYGRAAAEVRGRFGEPGEGLTATVRAGGRRASSEAPLAQWPGAGIGRRGDVLLRAHPLVREGRIAGPAFGRGLLHGSVGATRWLLSAGPVRAGVAGFVDAAAVSSRPAGWPGPEAAVDAGGGLRIQVGDRGTLRVDAAVGLADGQTAISAGWLELTPLR